MGTIRRMIALLLAIGLWTGGSPLMAQDSVDPEFLALIQGRWIIRFENQDTEIEIVGREGRLVNPDGKTLGRPGSQYTPRPGDVFMIITSATKRAPSSSRVDSRQWPEFDYQARLLSDYGNGWRMSDDSYPGSLTVNQVSCSDGPRTVYLYDHHSLNLFPGSVVTGSYYRREMKQRWLDNMADAMVTRQGNWQECARSGPNAPGKRTTAPKRPPANAAAPAPRTTLPAEPPVSEPVTSAQELAEIATRERLNREQAEFAAKQVADNAAAKAAFDKATADREATIAAQNAEAERKRRDHEAAMAKWRADVADAEACNRGEISRCKPQP